MAGTDGRDEQVAGRDEQVAGRDGAQSRAEGRRRWAGGDDGLEKRSVLGQPKFEW